MNSTAHCHCHSLKITPSFTSWKSKRKSSMSIYRNRVSASAKGKANSKDKDKNKDDYHSTLKALQSRGRHPRKSLGQHYMLNSSVNELLVKEAQVKDGDIVLEIGPGTGSLTNVLLSAGALVFAIEKDPHMAALVSKRFENCGKVKVVQEDFTRCHIKEQISSFSASASEGSACGQLAKVVSNIPFNITTDVLKILLPMGDTFSHVVLLLQDETAMRVVDAAIATFKLKDPRDYAPVASPKSFFSMVVV